MLAGGSAGGGAGRNAASGEVRLGVPPTLEALGRLSGVGRPAGPAVPGRAGSSAACADRRGAVTAATAADKLLVDGRGRLAVPSPELEGSAMAGRTTGRVAGPGGRR